MKTSIATGAQDENRTHDLRITSALLYRLSYLGKASYSTDETVNGTTDRLRQVSFLFRASNNGRPNTPGAFVLSKSRHYESLR